MTRLYVLVATTWITLQQRAEQQQRRSGEAGLTTLEMVVLGLGLLGFAAAAVAVFQIAIRSRLDQIK